MQRTKQDISALIEKGEAFHLECKKAQGDLPGSLWESYSAFCNTDGGVILLGVKEFEDKHFQFLGYSEKAGSGFPKIFMGTDEQHWARPFLQEDFWFEQTTLTMPTVDLTENNAQPEGGVKGGVKATQKTGMKTGMKTADEIFRRIKADPSVSMDGLSKDLGKARSTIQEAIARLRTAGLIRRIGPDKGGHWEIVKPQPPTGGSGS